MAEQCADDLSREDVLNLFDDRDFAALFINNAFYRTFGTANLARRGSAPVPHYWSLLLLLPGTEQGHAPRAVGVDAVVPHRVALDE